MYIKDLETNEQYYMFLFEKWWHYFLLGFTWFLPHKAYLMKKKFATNQNTVTRHSSIKFGLLIGAGFLVSDLLQGINLYKVPESFFWIWNLIVYAIAVFSTYISWQFILKITRNNRELDYEKVEIVKIRFYSLNTVIHFYWKLFISFICVLILIEFIKFDIIFIFIAVVILNLFMFVFLLLAGFNTNIYSTDNRVFQIDNRRLNA